VVGRASTHLIMVPIMTDTHRRRTATFRAQPWTVILCGFRHASKVMQTLCYAHFRCSGAMSLRSRRGHRMVAPTGENTARPSWAFMLGEPGPDVTASTFQERRTESARVGPSSVRPVLLVGRVIAAPSARGVK
jgi:hypothetical protein